MTCPCTTLLSRHWNIPSVSSKNGQAILWVEDVHTSAKHIVSSIVLAYYVYKGWYFPMVLKRLEEDLMIVEMQENYQSHLIEQLNNVAGGELCQWRHLHDQVWKFLNHKEI